MDKNFREAMARLNPEQLAAVNTTQGPVLVIAGPGTGKTELLSARVANILSSTDAQASNILCLSFTNKAAVNMKERIIKLAGREGAKVSVKTFHSFAAEIMNLYPDDFWNAANLSVVAEPLSLDIVELIVSQLPLDNPLALKFAGQYTLLSDVQKAIGLAKDAGLTPEKLRAILEGNLAYIELVEPQLVKILSRPLSVKNLAGLRTEVENLAEMPIEDRVYPLLSLSTLIKESLDAALELDSGSGKTTQTGRWKKRWVQAVEGTKGMFSERRRNAWWRELAEVYKRYREALHQRGFYDYADMLVEVVSRLEQNPEIRADIQERFEYVLIDEFQDTNPAQLRLAHLITDHPALGGKPNLMAVGDDDQTIFKFSGAELNNMLGFKRSYPGAKTIVLSKNYRSSRQILSASERIIEQAQLRVVDRYRQLSKKLVAENPPAKSAEPKAVAYSSRELQLSQIARQIKRRYKPELEFAVLARSHDSLVRMAGVLRQLKVPVRYEQAVNILEHEIVEQVYLIVKLLLAIRAGDSRQADGLVHRIIRHPLWGIDSRELWRLAVGSAGKGNWLEEALVSPSGQISAVGNWFVWLAQHSSGQPLAVTLEQILGLRASGEFSSPLKSYFTDSAADSPNRYFHGLSAMQLLRALVHEFAKSREPTLEELVRFVEVNRENQRTVADESPFVTGSHAVQLLTVHKAKGLEFDEVYIIDAIDANWQPKTGGRKPPANLPLQPVGDDLDDYIRLMYVAATRAKSALTISAYYLDHAGKDVALSQIVQSAFDVQKLTQDSPQALIEVLEQNLRWPDLSGGAEREILKARLETYSLSVTHLINFLDLTRGGPQYFKERNLLFLPDVKTPNLSYGTAIHHALSAAQRSLNAGRLSLPAVRAQFASSLKTEQLSRGEHGRFLVQGKQTLDRLFKDFAYRLPAGSVPEQQLNDIRVGKAVLGGQLDRVDKSETDLKIIDYKTGRPLVSFETRDKAKALKAYKHKLQLVFYALLARHHPTLGRFQNVSGQMVYVDAQKRSELERAYAPTSDDLDRLRELVEAVYQRIVSLQLPDVSKYPKDIEGIKQFEQDLLKK